MKYGEVWRFKDSGDRMMLVVKYAQGAHFLLLDRSSIPGWYAGEVHWVNFVWLEPLPD